MFEKLGDVEVEVILACVARVLFGEGVETLTPEEVVAATRVYEAAYDEALTREG